MFARWTKNTLLTLLLAGLGQAVSAQTEDTRYYAIPAGPLSSAINQFMLHSGVSISMDANRIRTLVSPGLQGNYGLTEGLQKLLENTGYQATSYQGGYLLTEQTPANQPAANLVLPALEIQGHQESIYDVPGSVSRISREDIDRTGPRHASEILQATPGVFTVTNEQNPSVSVNIRGLKDFGRVNMNIDGMRQNYQRSGHGQRNGEMFFDTEFLSGVEISKGAGAGAGSAGTTGGVATFRTIETKDVLIDPEDTFGGRLRLSHGVPEWDNGQQLSGSLALAGRPTTNTDVLLAYSWKRSDAYEPGRKGQAFYWESAENYYDHLYDGWQLPVSVISGTGQQTDSLLLKGTWHITPYSSMKLTFVQSDMQYGESQSINEDQAALLAIYNARCHLDEYKASEFCQTFQYDPDNAHPISNTNSTTTYSTAVDWFYDPLSDWVDFSAKLYLVDTQNDSARLDSDYRLSTSTQTLGLTLQNTSHFFTRNSHIALNYGLEIFRDKNQPDASSVNMTGEQLRLASGSTPEGQRQISSFWMKGEWNLHDRLTISPGISWEHYRLWGVTGFSAYDMRQNPDGTPVDTYGDRLWQFAEIDADHTDSALLPSLGLAYILFDLSSNSLQFFANAGLGWRPPAITETLTAGAIPYHQPPINTNPNWYLKPEKTQSWEAGFNYLHSGLLLPEDRLSIKLTHFSNTTENYIRYVQGIALPGMIRPSMNEATYDNALNDLTYHGQELNLSYITPRFYTNLLLTHTQRKVGSTDHSVGNPYDHLLSNLWPLGNLDASNQYQTYWCLPDAPNNALQQNCLTSSVLYDPLVPEWAGKLTLGFRLLQQKLDLGTHLTCSSRTGWHAGGGNMTDGGNGEEGQRAFCVQDLYGSYQFNKHFTLGYNLKNLWDREYAQAMGDAMVKSYAPGRTLTAFLEARF